MSCPEIIINKNKLTKTKINLLKTLKKMTIFPRETSLKDK